MTTLLTLLAGVLVVLPITAVTGYFVAQEFAFMAVDRPELDANAAAGDTAAERALTITRRTSFMLSGAQLGLTVTGLLVGFVAEPLIGDSLGTMLGGVGVPTANGVGVGAVLALVFSTIVQMLFGERVSWFTRARGMPFQNRVRHSHTKGASLLAGAGREGSPRRPAVPERRELVRG